MTMMDLQEILILELQNQTIVAGEKSIKLNKKSFKYWQMEYAHIEKHWKTSPSH